MLLQNSCSGFRITKLQKWLGLECYFMEMLLAFYEIKSDAEICRIDFLDLSTGYDVWHWNWRNIDNVLVWILRKKGVFKMAVGFGDSMQILKTSFSNAIWALGTRTAVERKINILGIPSKKWLQLWLCFFEGVKLIG